MYTIELENEPTPSKEEYTIAVSRLVEAYASADNQCAIAMLKDLGYSTEASEHILYTAHAVTIRNS